MNIKEHIEAGHYPLKREGYTVVPLRNGKDALIIATDYRNPDFPEWPILGIVPHRRESQPFAWTATGGYHGEVNPLSGRSALDLLPPPPRKVKRWAALTSVQMADLRMFESDGPAQ